MASRLMPQALFSELWPDRPDPMRRRKYLCRLCGKPVPSPKRFYCSDECTTLVQISVSWEYTRRLVFKRDQGVCQFPGCGKAVTFRANQTSNTAHIHHIFPVKDIYKLCWELIREWNLYDYDRDDVEARKKMNHVFAVLYTLMFLDLNNLTTYCTECHKLVHAADNRGQWYPNYYVPRTYWANFWDMAHREHYTKKLTDWF